jgi:hypothetical protein
LRRHDLALLTRAEFVEEHPEKLQAEEVQGKPDILGRAVAVMDVVSTGIG